MIRSISLCVSALALVGCAHSGEAAKPRSAKGQLEVLDPKDETNFYRVAPRTGSLFPVAANQNGRDAAADRRVAEQCGLTEPTRSDGFKPAFLPGLAAIAVGWVIDYVISEVSSAAQQRVAEYSALTAGELRFGPTRNGTMPGRLFYASVSPPTMNWNCLRFARMDNKGSTVFAEAIVKIQVAPRGDTLLLQPLRLYFDTPLAREGSEFGVALGVSFDALWQFAPTGEGKVARVFNATVLKQKIDIGKPDRPRFFYYDSDETEQVPLVPWSQGAIGSKQPAGAGTLTVTLAEAGDPPFLLTLFAGLAKDHGGELGGLLKDAAKAAIVK